MKMKKAKKTGLQAGVKYFNARWKEALEVAGSSEQITPDLFADILMSRKEEPACIDAVYIIRHLGEQGVTFTHLKELRAHPVPGKTACEIEVIYN
jgi:hypothetical protein